MRASELLKMIKFLFSFFLSVHCGVHSICTSQLNNLVESEMKKNYARNGSKGSKKIKPTLVLQFSVVSMECQRFEVGTITFSPEKVLGMNNLLLRSLGQVDSRTDLVSMVLCCEALFCFLSRRSLVLTSASFSSVL